jgi:hypothetical protein
MALGPTSSVRTSGLKLQKWLMWESLKETGMHKTKLLTVDTLNFKEMFSHLPQRYPQMLKYRVKKPYK